MVHLACNALFTIVPTFLRAFWFPWWPFMMKILRIPSAAADTATSRTIARSVDGRRLRLKSGACSRETPYCIGGKRRYPVFLHNRLEISCAKSASVDTGRCAPCCSMEPTGMRAFFYSSAFFEYLFAQVGVKSIYNVEHLYHFLMWTFLHRISIFPFM